MGLNIKLRKKEYTVQSHTATAKLNGFVLRAEFEALNEYQSYSSNATTHLDGHFVLLDN